MDEKERVKEEEGKKRERTRYKLGRKKMKKEEYGLKKKKKISKNEKKNPT
jgi:hypothetical protein